MTIAAMPTHSAQAAHRQGQQVNLGDEQGHAVSARPQPGESTTTLAHRDQAYRQLALIAVYLAKTESHRPAPYLNNRAVD